MKNLVMILSTFLMLLLGVAKESYGVEGLYVGAKIGTGLVHHERGFGMAAGGMTITPADAAMFGDPTLAGDYSWGEHLYKVDSSNKAVLAGGVFFGYDLERQHSIPLRIELDFTMRGKATTTLRTSLPFTVTKDGFTATADSLLQLNTNITLNTIMTNFWFDIPTGTAFTPYVGGGLGLALVKVSTNDSEYEGGAWNTISYTKKQSNFAWSLGAGISYDINEHLTCDLGYRFISAGKIKRYYYPDEGGLLFPEIKNIQSHDIFLGLRYTF
jgi:opacity protein-like surface antigen